MGTKNGLVDGNKLVFACTNSTDDYHCYILDNMKVLLSRWATGNIGILKWFSWQIKINNAIKSLVLVQSHVSDWLIYIFKFWLLTWFGQPDEVKSNLL